MTLRARLGWGLFAIVLVLIIPLLISLRSLEQLYNTSRVLRDREFAASLLLGSFRERTDDTRRAEDALLFIHELGHNLGLKHGGTDNLNYKPNYLSVMNYFFQFGGVLRSGGGIAVVTNGTPLWLQDSEWSQTLAECLGQWTGKRPTGACQTDEAGRRLNREALMSAGYRVVESAVDYDAELTIDEVVGGVFSAMSGDRMPPPQRREEFAAQVRDALARHEPLTEHVRVSLQFGHGP